MRNAQLFALALTGAILAESQAKAEGVLRIAMTATDIPTATATSRRQPAVRAVRRGMTRARVLVLASYRKIDVATVAIVTKEAAFYVPYVAVYILFTSCPSFGKGGCDWSNVALFPPAGTGPFELTRIVPR
ncbi:hypothetical protein [Rhodoplanes sp. Z2-YC6860]|uniref:hypothetical protein n=1 Tax=Rhodoplanes sp. Z2-YC6860 TaxID=674703 RepID=UPI00078CBEB9|nr:hypothetical protein [Rhodoplanes sp. Z2-YC6860]AMN42926.1 4-phytase [Rhodoplanes sp. Z2-YC6860]